MKSPRRHFVYFSSILLASVSLARGWAEEPTVRRLVELAPTLDSSDGACKSLDVGGFFNLDGKGVATKLRFRALYRKPQDFLLMVTDMADGTPLAECVNSTIFIYDPVSPLIYRSANACFTLEAARRKDRFVCQYYSNVDHVVPHRIVVDLRSLLPDVGQAIPPDVHSRIAKKGPNNYELNVGKSYNGHTIDAAFTIDLTKNCYYKGMRISWDGDTVCSIDRLVLNEELRDELFAFPAKDQFPHGLPFRDVTNEKGAEARLSISATIIRAAVVRSVINDVSPTTPPNVPGLSNIDWNRVKESDQKFAKSLRALVPSGLRERKQGREE